jgi:hypothetical protein
MSGEDEKAGAEAPKWVYDGPETKTMVLRKELKLTPKDQNPVTEITLSEPTAQQMSAMENERRKTNEISAGALFIALNAGISHPHALRMGSRDFEEALDFLSGFTEGAPQAGN